MTACTFPSCRRPARAKGLCSGHLSQRDRGKPLAPLGHRGDHERPILSLRVEPEVKAKALADPEGARNALTRWSKRKP